MFPGSAIYEYDVEKAAEAGKPDQLVNERLVD